jgi:hypothetical protein
VPLLIFLRYHGYSLLRIEVLICFGLFALAGLVLGAIMMIGRTAGRVLFISLLVLLVFDLQTTGPTMKHLLGVWLGLVALGWLIRNHLSRLTCLLAGVVLVSTFVVPGGPPAVWREGSPSATTPGPAGLPFILHIVLDEQIGIEGIPAEFDPGGEVAGNLAEFFLANDFEVYGRAYSRFYNTQDSLTNLLNFAGSQEPSRFFEGPFHMGMKPRENAWFAKLFEKGYAVHVVQSDYLAFLDNDDVLGNPDRRSSLSYVLETIKTCEEASLAPLQKAKFILGSLSKLSYLLKWSRDHYVILRSSGIGKKLNLPGWGESCDRINTLSAMKMAHVLNSDLDFAAAGKAYLAHLMLPHYPYAYEEGCRLKGDIATWLYANDAKVSPRRNDSASRAERYPQYLKQVVCTAKILGEMFTTLKNRGLWDESIIIIHGDHGSRIDRGPPSIQYIEKMTDKDFVDAYSTLFAVKRPGVPGRYDDRLLPVDHLFARIFGEEREPGDEFLQDNPHVFVENFGDEFVRKPMPRFSRAPGLPAGWN